MQFLQSFPCILTLCHVRVGLYLFDDIEEGVTNGPLKPLSKACNHLDRSGPFRKSKEGPFGPTFPPLPPSYHRFSTQRAQRFYTLFPTKSCYCPGVDPGAVVVLISGVVTVFAAGVTCVLAGVVCYGLWKLRPHQELEVELSGQRAMIQNLEAQIIHLRTKKAGRVSADRRAAETPQGNRGDNPLLEGLSDEEAALFM